MVQVIQAGPEAFDLLTYPEQNPFNTQFIKNQFDRLTYSANSFGQQFIQDVRQAYENIQNSDIVQRAKQAIRNAGIYHHPNMIYQIDELDAMQTADLGMQRWLMANPVLRDYYHKGLANGYSETYVDMYPGQSGEDHYDYRRVMQGIVNDQQEDCDFVFDQYIEDLVPGDRELEFNEQVDILNTWNMANLFILAANQDPSNPFGGELG